MYCNPWLHFVYKMHMCKTYQQGGHFLFGALPTTSLHPLPKATLRPSQANLLPPPQAASTGTGSPPRKPAAGSFPPDASSTSAA